MPYRIIVPPLDSAASAALGTGFMKSDILQIRDAADFWTANLPSVIRFHSELANILARTEKI